MYSPLIHEENQSLGFDDDFLFKTNYENGEQNHNSLIDYINPNFINPFEPRKFFFPSENELTSLIDDIKHDYDPFGPLLIPRKNRIPTLIEDTESSSAMLRNKRGRKKIKNTSYGEHDCNKNDCKMAKIQTNYISFLIIFFNSIMKSYNLNYKFLQLEGKFKSNINQKFRSILNKKTIKEILFSYPISKKYKNYNKFHNVEIINKLEEEGQADILNLLDKNLLFFFDIFFESKKIFDLSSFGLGTLTVKLPSKTKLFDDLIKKTKHENPDKYELEMKRCKYKFFS